MEALIAIEKVKGLGSASSCLTPEKKNDFNQKLWKLCYGDLSETANFYIYFFLLLFSDHEVVHLLEYM